MGCGGSKQVDMSSVSLGLTQKMSLDGMVTPLVGYFKLKQNLFDSTEKFTIKDTSDNEFIVVGEKDNPRMSQRLYGVHGEKVALFSRMPRGDGEEYWIWSYKPNHENHKQDQTDEENIPRYFFGRIEKVPKKDSFLCYLQDDIEKYYTSEPIMRGDAQFGNNKYNMKIRMDKGSPNYNGKTPIVGILGEQRFEVGPENWGLQIAKGMDPVLTIIFCIAAQDLKKSCSS